MVTPLQLAAACAAYEEIVGAGPAPALRVRFAAMTAAFATAERLAPAQVTVPRELLEQVLAEMELNFNQIDSEWGPTPGGLEGAIKCGEAEAIRQLREVLK